MRTGYIEARIMPKYGRSRRMTYHCTESRLAIFSSREPVSSPLENAIKCPSMFETHFQTFEEPESGVALSARLAAFREELARRKLTGFVVPRADQQQNEYVPASEERLAWLTGFTGSAGMPFLLTKAAAVFRGRPHPRAA